jgi:peroxiredoxin
MSKDRQRTNPPQRADDLADITLPNQDGNEVRLGDLWGDRPVALVWLRHYG